FHGHGGAGGGARRRGRLGHEGVAGGGGGGAGLPGHHVAEAAEAVGDAAGGGDDQLAQAFLLGRVEVGAVGRDADRGGLGLPDPEDRRGHAPHAEVELLPVDGVAEPLDLGELGGQLVV